MFQAGIIIWLFVVAVLGFNFGVYYERAENFSRNAKRCENEQNREQNANGDIRWLNENKP